MQKEKKKRTAAFSNMMAFLPQKPVKSHRDSHFPYPSMTFDTPTIYKYLWKTALVVAKPWNIIEEKYIHVQKRTAS